MPRTRWLCSMRDLRAAMERAIAGVLYTAGFTVALQPPLRDAGLHEESGAKVS